MGDRWVVHGKKTKTNDEMAKPMVMYMVGISHA